MPVPVAPRLVSRFEADLLRILWYFMGRLPREQAVPLVHNSGPRPKCLSRAAVELAQDTLAKGCMVHLARAGGWRRQRHLRGEGVAEGRLWERTPPEELALVFSRHALDFLIWVTATRPPDQEKWRWVPREEELTAGDRLLFYIAYEALRGTDTAIALRALPPYVHHGLCWLAFPDDFAVQSGGKPDLGFWTRGMGACILEALQTRLAERWTQMERAKGQISNWRQMRALGQTQEWVLNSFLGAADSAGRRDLARFLLQAAAGVLRDNPQTRAWVGELDMRGLRVADRTETYRAAPTLLRTLDRLQQWDNQARTVGYLDEGYAAGQLWKADWQAWEGEILWARAQAVIRQLEPLKV